MNFLGVLSPNAEKSAKIDFAYRIYDVDGDGVVNASDLQTILRMMVGENLNDETLDEVRGFITEQVQIKPSSNVFMSTFRLSSPFLTAFMSLKDHGDDNIKCRSRRRQSN